LASRSERLDDLERNEYGDGEEEDGGNMLMVPQRSVVYDEFITQADEETE
jgi:hypothetical protein